jgi:hypothetical protein
MTHQHKDWKRNVEGLRKTAREKAEVTQNRVDEAIRLLVKERGRINFRTVAETAHVSTAWLYANEEIKMRIIHLRSQQAPKAQARIPPQERASNASKDAVIKALQKRVAKQADKISKLEERVKIAYGELGRQYLDE